MAIIKKYIKVKKILQKFPEIFAKNIINFRTHNPTEALLYFSLSISHAFQQKITESWADLL